MNLRYLFSFALALSIVSCNSKNKPADIAAEVTPEKLKETVADAVKLIGSYVGSFGDNKITLLITKANKDSVEGRSVVGGNDRPFSGIVKQAGSTYTITAKEPGGDPHDGTFDFAIDSKSPDVVKGSWKPYNPTEKIAGKEYTLQRKSFVYRTDVGNFSDASKRLLKEEDVNNLTKEELEFMRNEIFARHGYCFKKKTLREAFEDLDWYIPNTVDVKNDLTDIERKNLALIKKYEKYAEEYGDEFGR